MIFTKNSKSLHASHNQRILFVHSRVWRHLYRDTVQSFKTLQLYKFVENDKNTIKLYYSNCFLHKSNKQCKENQGWHVLYIRGYDSHTQNVKLCNFITSWYLIKSPQNLLSPYNQQKYDMKTGVKLWPQFPFKPISRHKQWSFRLRIFSVNVTESAENCGFGHTNWRKPHWKLHFLCSVSIRHQD